MQILVTICNALAKNDMFSFLLALKHFFFTWLGNPWYLLPAYFFFIYERLFCITAKKEIEGRHGGRRRYRWG